MKIFPAAFVPRMLIIACFCYANSANSECLPTGKDWYLSDTIICSGVDSDGWSGSASLTNIVIGSDALVKRIFVGNLYNPDDPNPLNGGGNEVYNFGTIEWTILVGHDNYVENHGTVQQIGSGEWSTLINETTGFVTNPFREEVGIGGDEGTDVINRGSITMTGSVLAAGIGVYDNSTATNESSGLISTLGSDSFGILGIGPKTGVILRNQGSIDVSGNLSEGMGVRGDAIMENTGTINAAGDGSEGMTLIGHAGQIDNSGFINTTGIENIGISATFGAGESYLTTISITNSNSIVTNGFQTIGIDAEGYTNAGINNNGKIETSGKESVGIFVTGDDAAINNDAAGTITTTGQGSAGIALFGFSGIIANKNLILVEGVKAIGIGAEGDGMTLVNTSTARVDVTEIDSVGMGVRGNNAELSNDGIVATQSSRSLAIGVEGDDALITMGPNSSVTTLGVESPGVKVLGNFVDLTNGGLISTKNDLSPGILVDGFTLLPNPGPDITNEGDISTMGNSSPGISALGIGHYVYNEIFSFITTTGVNSPGIEVGSAAAPNPNSEVFNAGVITTDLLGSDSHGVSIFGDKAKFTNDATGVILTKGPAAHGVSIHGENADISSNGSIKTTGLDSIGLTVLGNRTDNTKLIDISGSIITEGDRGHGIKFDGDNYTIQVSATGSIKTSGDDAIGIKVGDPGAMPTVSAKVTSLGTIETTGKNAHGIMVFAETVSPGETSRYLNTDGKITTQHDNASGIFVDGSDWEIDNRADITTGGENANGISVFSDDAILGNSAQITTTGSSAHGLSVVANYSATVNSGVINTGSETTAGGSTAHGINLEGNGHTVWNKGTITAIGPTSYGIRAAGKNIKITNQNKITVTGFASMGVYLATQSNQTSKFTNEGTGTVTNTRWTISSPSGTGIAIQGGDGDDTVDNSGIITGDIFLRSGNDELILKDGSQIAGISDGGVSASHKDTLTVEVNSADTIMHLIGDSFVNFEQFNKKGTGAAFLNGTLAVDKAHIEAGYLQVQSTGILDVSEIQIWGPVPGDRCKLSTCLVMNDGELRSGKTIVGVGGSIAGVGTIDAPEGPFTVDGGWIGPGFSTGTLVVNTDFHFISGVLELEADSLFDTDKLVIGGDFNITNGLIEVMLGFTPNIEDVLEFFMIAGTTNIPDGYNPIVGIAAAGSGVPLGTRFTISIGNELFDGVVTSAVPVPAAFWLFGSAVGLLGWARRKSG